MAARQVGDKAAQQHAERLRAPGSTRVRPIRRLSGGSNWLRSTVGYVLNPSQMRSQPPPPIARTERSPPTDTV
jgi:hypothetical protein